MVAHGGGGPMHCAVLARDLKASRVTVSKSAAVFSAWGMLMSDIRHDWIRTIICPLETTSVDEINSIWVDLIEKAYQCMYDEGLSDSEIVFSAIVDMRYQGQEHTVPVQTATTSWDNSTRSNLTEFFHKNHEHFYSFRLDDTPVEIVNFHLVALGMLDKPGIAKIDTLGNEVIVPENSRNVLYDDGKWRDTPVYLRSKLKAGFSGTGPMLIDEKTATTLVLPDQILSVDEYGNLIINTGVK